MPRTSKRNKRNCPPAPRRLPSFRLVFLFPFFFLSRELLHHALSEHGGKLVRKTVSLPVRLSSSTLSLLSLVSHFLVPVHVRVLRRSMQLHKEGKSVECSRVMASFAAPNLPLFLCFQHLVPPQAVNPCDIHRRTMWRKSVQVKLFKIRPVLPGRQKTSK